MNFPPTAADQEFFNREPASFVPDKIFDPHCRLWHARRVSEAEFPDQFTYPMYRQWIDALHPGRVVVSIFIPVPDDPQWVRQGVRRLKLSGLQCYHIMSSVTPTWEADIPTYLPERIIKEAHEEGLLITLHMVKSRGVADSFIWLYEQSPVRQEKHRRIEPCLVGLEHL